MPKLIFITLMGYCPWGGSEELWQKTALFARAEGIITEAHLFDISKDHNKVRELQQNGSKVLFRKHTHTLFDRIIRKLHLERFNGLDKDQYWNKHLVYKDALYVISGGTTFDCWDALPLFNELKARKLSYVYISQHHPEHAAPLDNGQKQIIQQIFAEAKKVYFVSKRNQHVTERQLAANIPNAEVIYNPINVNVGSLPLPDSINSDSLRLACVARLECSFKGQDMLLETLSAGKWKERNIQISFFGKGPDEQYLKQLADYFGVNHLVNFRGHVEDIKEAWRDHHALIMSSTAEGTPLALMEAMACARSAVLTDVGGNAEWIQDGYNGFLASAPTPTLIDEALEQMWQNKHRLAELNKNAYDTFNRKYPQNSIAYFFNKLMQL